MEQISAALLVPAILHKVQSLPAKLSKTFARFFESERTAGSVLMISTLISLAVANSSMGADYIAFWHVTVGGLSVEQWINDGLMAFFFLLIGLELEREFYNGELSSFRSAALPITAAVGGVILPAIIHYSLNHSTPDARGAGIPMATDIAFSLGVLALVGKQVPASLKVFLVAFAVIDDLIAVTVIALFYTSELVLVYLAAAITVWLVLVVLNRYLRLMSLVPYMMGGAVIWMLMLRSGIHPTISGVLLAFAIPFSPKRDDAGSPSHRLEHMLQRPAAFIVLPLFALANTSVMLSCDWSLTLLTANSLGIALGLAAGKPIGILTASFLAVGCGLCRLPDDLGWKHIMGAGLLGGVGFTMSIFITNLAFEGHPEQIDSSKVATLAASLVAGILGFVWLTWIIRFRGVLDVPSGDLIKEERRK